MSQPVRWKPILKRSTFVSLVVGTVLNLINQSDAIMGDGSVIWWKFALTYMVPFVVSAYAAWSALRSAGQ